MKEMPSQRVALLLLLSVCVPISAMAHRDVVIVTAAATAAFPTGATYGGVSVTELRVGIGVDIPGDGSASGQFDGTLLGRSASGESRTITVDGLVTGGSNPATGSATFSGASTVDMGDGSAPAQKVPFTVVVAAPSGGQSTITLTLGATSLPAATVTDGSLTVK